MDLLTADIAQAKFPDADRLVFSALANQRQALVANTIPQLNAPYNRLMASHVTPGVTAAMNAAEATVINTPWRRGPAPAAVTGANAMFIGYEVHARQVAAASAPRCRTRPVTMPTSSSLSSSWPPGSACSARSRPSRCPW